MEDETLSLEEGEISEDSDNVNNYTPLERPTNYSVVSQNPRFPLLPQDSESEEEVQSTESDSDSDLNVRHSKKPKIKLKPKLVNHRRQKKYDIWSTRVQEDVLSETLNSCDVSKKDRSRDVESYDYTIGHKYYSSLEAKEDRKSNKRTRDDRRNAGIRLTKRSASENKNKTSKPRIILELAVKVEDSPEDIAKDIANKLCEEKEELILKVVNEFGKENTIEVFNETKKIESEGGMMIMNQTRRRTPGGLFLYLVRNHYHITREQINKIFGEERLQYKNQLHKKKKDKNKKFKEEIAAARAKLLPDLLTRAELLSSQSNRTRKETDERDVINPPPTPETDCHENSCDGMESLNAIPQPVNEREVLECTRGKLQSYEDDFLDIGCSNDMDLF